MGQQGELVTFGYNTVGQLTSVTSDDGTQYVANTTYNAQGQVTEQRMDSGANGFTRQYSYNANTLRLETLKAGTAAPFENLQKLAYAYDLAGNVQTLTDATNSGQVQSFGYDWLDRLTSAATNAAGIGQYSHSHTYAYNAIGNIASYNGNAYTYGSKPHAVTAAFGNSYGYDAVGNQTSRTVGGVAYTQTFDYDNRLTGVAGGSVSATFLYDAAGNRVKGTVAGVTTVYIAGLYEWQNGAVTKYYEGGAIRRIGYANDNGVFYVVSDQLRSTSVLVNRDGTVKSRNFYYPYGGNRGGSAFSGVTTKRFTGQYHEQGLPGGEGLSFYNARWYDAQVGVFISADTLVPSPLAPQTLNRYAYAGGNPLRWIDPTGHMQADPDNGYRTRSQPKVVWPSPFRFTSPVRPQPPVVNSRGASVVVQPRAPLPTLTPFVRPMAPAAYAEPQWNATPKYAPNDGWILKYRVRGDVDPRLEYVHVSSYATRGIVPLNIGGEYRSVMVFDEGGVRRFEEPALSLTAGLVLNGGVEWTPSEGLQPTIGASLAGFEAQLQGNQAMLGFVNPAGIGGGRIGAEFSVPGVQVLATSQTYLVEKGGAQSLGQFYFGTNASLEWSMWIPGGYAPNGAWVSGADRATSWATWAPVQVVP